MPFGEMCGLKAQDESDGGTEGKAGEVSEQLAAEAAVADGVAAQEDKN